MTESTRPKRVIVVDAENPLQEVSGEFFWRDDHDRILAQAQETAYARGFADATAAAQERPVQVRLGVQRRRVPRTSFRVVLALIALAFLVSLIGEIVSTIHSS